AADELALDVELRDGRPVRIGLDAVTQFGRLQYVEAFVGHAEVVEDLHHLPGEAALRELRGAFHEQHHVVALHFIVDELLDCHGSPRSAARESRPVTCDICSADSAATSNRDKYVSRQGFAGA